MDDDEDNFEDCIDEFKEEIPNHLEEFRKLIKSVKKFPQTIPDVVLMRFLKVCNNDCQKAFELIQLNYKLRTNAPNLFTNRDINAENMRTACDVLQFSMMPSLTKDKLKVSIGGLNNTDASKFNYVDCIKMGLMMFDVRFTEHDSEDGEIAEGEISVMDMKGMSFRHFLKMLGSLATARVYMRFLEEASPMKICQSHIVNPSGIVDKMFAVFRPFMSKEILESMYVHSSLESLHKVVPKENLPIEFGGTSGLSMKDTHEACLKLMESKREYLLDDDNWRFLD